MAGAIQSKDARQKRQPVGVSDIQGIQITSSGDYIVELSIVSEKISIQQEGTLAGTVTFSLSGVSFVGSIAIPATGAISNYTTSLAKVIKITVTSGSGRIVIAGK